MNEEIYRTYAHNPPHLFRANGKYFITGATYRKYPYLKSVAAKEKAVEYMFKSFEHFGWTIEDWVLLDNHYHIMADAPGDAMTLSNVINNFHKFSAIWVRKNIVEFSDCVADGLRQSTNSTNYSGKDGSTQSSHSKTRSKTHFKASKIWYNYWDSCITYKRSYFARLTYIWFNPAKHDYVADPGEWRFGSFFFREEQGEKVGEIIEKYPWDKVRVKDDF